MTAAVGLLLFGCGSSEVTAPRDLSAALEKVRREAVVPGLAAAVAAPDTILAEGACGERTLGGDEPLIVGDPMHIGSCTKAMTATLVAILVQEGTLSWATTIGEGLPQLAVTMNPRYRDATLEDLLTHRAGIPPYTDLDDAGMKRILGYPGDAAAQRYAFVSELLREPPVRDEAGAAYSNAGYTVAAVIVERAAGRPWEELMRARLFEPLGMSSARFGWPRDPLHPEAPGGHLVEAGRLRPFEVGDPYRLGPCLAPGGDVACSMADLVVFAQFHLTRGRSRPGLLREAAFEKLHGAGEGGGTAGVAAGQGGHAMGWQIVAAGPGESVLMHDGSAGPFYCRVVIFPTRKRAVVVAANAGEPNGRDACEKAIGAALTAVRDDC